MNVEKKLKKLRKSGINIIGDVHWGTHLCQFYKIKEDLTDILVPYFKAGLENNEFCIWVTSEPLSEKEAEEAMRKAVSNFDQYLKKGQIEIISHDEWYLKGGIFDLKRVLNAWIDKLKQALANGYGGIRVTGNTAWLEKKDWKNFADYEEEVNKAIGKYNMLAICTYSLDKCGASEIIDVVKNHQFALIRKEGKWVVIESSGQKKAEEEIKSLKEFNENIVANIPSPMVVFDKDLRIVSANYAFYNTYKQTPENIVGKTIYETSFPALIKKLKADEKTLNVFKTGKILEEFGLEIDSHFVGKRILNVKYVPIVKWKAEEEEEREHVMVIIDDVTETKKLEKDKKILTEKVVKLTKKIPLTQNEKLVFYGLVKYPLLNDQQLSEKLKIKRSTITAIKNKLLRQGFYSTRVIPNFELIGCELMCIINSKMPAGGGG